MLLIFSHQLTDTQIQSAKKDLGVDKFHYLPEELQYLWNRIPPDVEDINPYLKSITKWIDTMASKDDYILVQGDFGATYKIVSYCKLKGFTTVYSTTKRDALESRDENGKIVLTHKVSHVMYRRYY